MLVSIVLRLVAPRITVLPGYLGRANYAAVLERLATVDPALSSAIHDGDGPKPITCSGLLEARPSQDSFTVQAGALYRVRITGLTEAACRALSASMLAAPPTTWTLDGCEFGVAGTVCDHTVDPWSGRTTYEELAVAQLLQSGAAPRTVTLEFVSPTAFKSGGLHVPVPMPSLVFGSLVERWNAFSSITLSPEMRRFGEEMVAISRYRLESRALAQKDGGLRIGGIGRVTYRALNNDRYWLGVMQMLAEYAFYSGVGIMTTVGMGQARQLVQAQPHLL